MIIIKIMKHFFTMTISHFISHTCSQTINLSPPLYGYLFVGKLQIQSMKVLIRAAYINPFL